MSSLTSPNDRSSVSLNLQHNAPPLTNEEMQAANADLNDMSFIKKYPQIERVFADPTIHDQKYCLCSFIPSKDAVPDKDGIFGMIKFRGAYQSLEESNARAEFLIQNIDSYHKIYHCYVGKPFPATSSSKFSQETAEVDIRKKVTQVVSEDIKQQKLEEQKEIREIKEREENLLRQNKEDYKEDPFDTYITLRVKKAQLVWTYLETMKKMEQVKQNIINARADIKEMDAENPEFIKNYKQKYMDARDEAGLKENADSSFMQYLGDDIDTVEKLGF